MDISLKAACKSWMERALARNIADVATEMRLADITDLATMIQNEKCSHISDFINSSTELYFRPGTLKYALTASIDVRWESYPSVLFDMEFCHGSVTVFFKIILQHRRASVEVFDAHFEDDGLSPIDQARCVSHALADARLDRRGSVPQFCSGVVAAGLPAGDVSWHGAQIAAQAGPHVAATGDRGRRKRRG